MKVYVVVEFFLGGLVPKVRGVFIDKMKAQAEKEKYRFSFIDEHDLIQMPSKKDQVEVYVVIELLYYNVPKLIGVFKNRVIAEEVSPDRGYEVQIIEEKLII